MEWIKNLQTIFLIRMGKEKTCFFVCNFVQCGVRYGEGLGLVGGGECK